jgi:hypothetical protein
LPKPSADGTFREPVEAGLEFPPVDGIMVEPLQVPISFYGEYGRSE